MFAVIRGKSSQSERIHSVALRDDKQAMHSLYAEPGLTRAKLYKNRRFVSCSKKEIK